VALLAVCLLIILQMEMLIKSVVLFEKNKHNVTYYRYSYRRGLLIAKINKAKKLDR